MSAEIIQLRPCADDPAIKMYEAYLRAWSAWQATAILRGKLSSELLDELSLAAAERQGRLFNAWLVAVGRTPGGA